MSSENVRPEEARGDEVDAARRPPPHHLGQFMVYRPRQVQVRFHLGNLCEAVANRILEETLDGLLTADGAVTYSVTQVRELSGAADRRYARLALGEEFLREEGAAGARPQQLDGVLHRILETQGLRPARARLAALQTSFFGDRINAVGRRVAQSVFDDLQMLAPNSLATLQFLLEQSITQLQATVEQSSRALASMEARGTQLQNALRDAVRAAAEANANAEGDAGPDPPSGGRWRRGWQAVSGFFARALNSGDDAPQQPDVPAPTNDSRARHAAVGQLERELLDFELRVGVRQAEREAVKKIVEFLNFEKENHQTLLNLLHARQQEARVAAAQAEKARDYGLAGGELLLNGRELTEAAAHARFAADKIERKRWQDNFRTLCLDVVNRAGGRHDAALTQRMYEEVREQVRLAFGVFRVVDALVVLQRHNPHFPAKLRTIFEAIARPDFLAPGYERHLDLQRFAHVSYVPSEDASVTVAFRAMLTAALQAAHVEAKELPVRDDQDTMRFHVNDYVPLTALGVYHRSRDIYEQHRNDPRYNVHPELAA